MKTKPAAKKSKEVTVVNVTPQIENHSVTPDQMIMRAIDKGMSVEQLEKLVALQVAWMAREARKEYLVAKAQFQKNVPVILKVRDVSWEHKDKRGSTDYSYAPLGEITERIKHAESDAGLSHDWKIEEMPDGHIKVAAVISHIGGHVEVGLWLQAKPDPKAGQMSDVQRKGSVITFLQRYTLIAALGLSTVDKDDDGRSASRSMGEDTPYEEAKPTDGVTKKEKITAEKYEEMVENVMTGKATADEVEKIYVLSEKQIKSLKVAESQFSKVTIVEGK